MNFRVHGSTAIEVQGQILIARIGGPWNLELIQLYQSLVGEHVAALAEKGPWGLIIEITGAALCPPNALELIRAGAHAQAKTSRRACTCYVIAPDVEGFRLMDRVWRDIYLGVVPFEIFETRAEALAWTAEQLAQS